MKIVLADDQASMLKASEEAVKESASDNPGIQVVGTAANGKELISALQKNSNADVALIDIRMPVMDGLTALVIAKAKYPKVKIVVVSSETERSMKMKSKESSDFQKQVDMLGKLADRLKAGQPPEPGKINSMLEGCEKLGADPIKIAEHFGASGFIQKPINAKKLGKLLSQINGSKFVHVSLF